MPLHYLVDGHNLIGQTRTIRLQDPDDEAKLVDLLHRWTLRQSGVQVTVVFDGGVYGHPQPLDRPAVRAIFAHSPQDADARLNRLIEQITDERRYRVVTSDRAVASVAEAHGIVVINAGVFAKQLEQPESQSRRSTPRRQRIEPKLSRNEVDSWLREFGDDREKDR